MSEITEEIQQLQLRILELENQQKEKEKDDIDKNYDSYVKNGFYVYRTAAEVQMAAHKMTNPNLKELPKEPLYDFYLKNGFYAYRTAEELLLAVKRMIGERPPKGYCISGNTQDPVPALGLGGIPLNEGVYLLTNMKEYAYLAYSLYILLT